MAYRIYPEYKGRIKHVFLPDIREDVIAPSVDELAAALTDRSKPEITYVPLSKIGNSYSFWIRDPAIFLGYSEDKPVALMTEDRVLHSVGSQKDVEDSKALRKYLEAEGVRVEDVPFFVIGGDCLLTERHAVFGWVTPQVNGWAYGSYTQGISAIKKGLERFDVEPLFVDDVRALNEVVYHDRRLNGFFHLDTAVSFVEGRAGITAVVSYPLPPHANSDSANYAEHACEFLARSYSVARAPAIVSGDCLWSPTNAAIDEEKTIFVSDSFDTAINHAAEDAYGSEGYNVLTVDMERAVQEARGGVRCMSFLVRA